jgi:macrodomain Ter protein organizer (MatP/YcbG family)
LTDQDIEIPDNMDIPYLGHAQPEPAQPVQPVQPIRAEIHTETLPEFIRNEDRKETPKEIGINKPTPFDGDRKKVHAFLQECKVYLAVNRRVYATDEAKVAFVLSFMTEKEALKWKETYISSITNSAGEIVFPTIKQFWDLVEEYFKPADRIQDANDKLSILKQGNRPVEEMITEFRLLASQAGMTDITASDNLHLIRLFRNALHPTLAKKILFSENVPQTIKEWMNRAIQYDTNYRMAMAILGKPTNGARSTSTSTSYQARKIHDHKDPNAMDVDLMTTEKRTALMRKGACFICEEPGHLAKNCPKKKRNTNQKRTVNEIHAFIDALNKEEKEELASLQVSGETQDF